MSRGRLGEQEKDVPAGATKNKTVPHLGEVERPLSHFDGGGRVWAMRRRSWAAVVLRKSDRCQRRSAGIYPPGGGAVFNSPKGGCSCGLSPGGAGRPHRFRALGRRGKRYVFLPSYRFCGGDGVLVVEKIKLENTRYFSMKLKKAKKNTLVIVSPTTARGLGREKKISRVIIAAVPITGRGRGPAAG